MRIPRELQQKIDCSKFNSQELIDNSKILRELIEEARSDFTGENTLGLFNKLSIEDRKNMLKELDIFRSEIYKIKGKNISEYYINEYYNKYVKFCPFFLYTKKWANVDGFTEDIINKLICSVRSDQIDNINLDDYINMGKALIDNETIIKETLKTKRLGEFGEITLNEIVDKGFEVLSPLSQFTTDYSNVIAIGGSLISSYFFFKSVVRLYEKTAFKEAYKLSSADDLLKYNLIRSKEVKSFMVFAAPFIVGTFWVLKKQIGGPNVNINIQNNIEDNATSAGILCFIKNRIPKYLGPIIWMILCLFFMDLPSKIGESIMSSYLVYVKWFFFLGSITSFFMICYYIFSIYLVYKFSKQDTKISDFYPEFIRNWYKFNQSLSHSQNISLFIGIYYRLMFIYLIILLLCLLVLYIL